MLLLITSPFFPFRYVLFTVEFPRDNELSAAAMEGLKKFLPGPASMDLDYSSHEDVEIVHLEHADVRTFGKGGLQSRESAYDSDDDDEGGHPQGVQCQQS
jgi:DnaJ homolog subfamily A member 2